MAAALFRLPTSRVIDSNGIADGSTLTFYDTGTLTPRAVYTTSALSVEHPNPLTVAAGAAVPSIYLDDTYTYRCIVKNAAGTTIDDIDPYTGFDASAVNFIQSGTGAVSRTAQAKMRDIVSISDFGGATQTDAQQAVDAVKTNARGGTVVFPSAAYTSNAVVNVRGDFGGGIRLDGHGSKITSTHAGPIFDLGLLADPGPEYRLHAYLNDFNLTGPGKATVGSKGVAITDTADVYLHNGIYTGFQYAIYSEGGLIWDAYNLTLRDSGYGLYASDTASFAPNSISFYSGRIINNDLAIFTENNPNGVVSFFATEVEGNNTTSGADADGKKVTNHNNAGNINYFGAHFETNPGQYNLYFNGNDATKNLLIAGSQIIATAAEQVHVERGQGTFIASRITSGGKLGVVFGANASGTLIDCETDISGTLSGVLGIRQGKLGFGNNPVNGDPVIKIGAASIGASSNVALLVQHDTSIIRWSNTAGTQIGYFQTTAAGEHTFVNTNAAGGFAIGGHSAVQLYVGRAGNDSIEPGGNATITNGSGALNWNGVYSNAYYVGSTKVVGAQGAAVADATDAASAITQLNALLARMRAHGLIAT